LEAWEVVGETGLEDSEPTYLFLVVQTLVVVLEYGHAFRFPRVVFGIRVRDVAGEDFLPEGEAARGA
jgi:hypothetical protein